MTYRAGNKLALPPDSSRGAADAYVLEDQIGFILRRANQRHAGIFAARIGTELTATQFATLAKLNEMGSCTQNLLGRNTAMDAATIKGVVDRLTRRGLTRTWPDPKDRRRMLVSLTDRGERVLIDTLPRAREITECTLEPLDKTERKTFLRLLEKLC
jgi:MarR family transcriptional regulator, lower aerobic nicotinate degradation pathway regulator